jgi:hypothetical protein
MKNIYIRISRLNVTISTGSGRIHNWTTKSACLNSRWPKLTLGLRALESVSADLKRLNDDSHQCADDVHGPKEGLVGKGDVC